MNKAFYIASFVIIICCLHNCQKEEEEIIPDPILLNAVIKNVSVNGGGDGSIDLTVSGGTPPYAFHWSNDQTSEDIDSLSAGTYIVMVYDNNLKTQSDTFIITQPASDTLLLTLSGHDVSVYGGNDGAAYADVSGGVIPYRYKWSNGSTDKDILGLTAGLYSLTVKDAEGTTVTDSILISQLELDAIIINYEVTQPSFTGASDGSINVTATGGSPPYSFLWSTGHVSEDLYNLAADTYTLTVKDQTARTVEISVVLSDLLMDIDGTAYTIVKIGEQRWMGENLKVTRTPDSIPVVSYAYNDDTSYVKTYGRLYTWYVAMNNATLENSQGICPCGWHVPSDEEFKILEMFLGMTRAEADMENTWRGDSVGTRLIIGGSSGYDAKLCGRRSSGSAYSLLGVFEYMWTSTEYGDCAWRRCLDINSDLCGRWNTFPKSYGFSVRCIKNK